MTCPSQKRYDYRMLGGLPFYRISFLVAAMALGGAVAAQTVDERKSTLHAFEVAYGRSLDAKSPRFDLRSRHLLVPSFSEDGLLIEISIEAKPEYLTRAPKISRSEFDSLLASLVSIKPLGAFEDDDGKFVSGWRAHGRQRYQNGFLETEELLGYGSPAPIASARIYYLHAVKGVPKIGPDETPDAVSFRLICFDRKRYIALESEFVQLLARPNQLQTAELAGPTAEFCSPDEELFKKGVAAIERQRFDVAAITLQTLINTYPDSEYVSPAKQFLSDPRIVKCSKMWIDPAACDGGTSASPLLP